MEYTYATWTTKINEYTWPSSNASGPVYGIPVLIDSDAAGGDYNPFALPSSERVVETINYTTGSDVTSAWNLGGFYSKLFRIVLSGSPSIVDTVEISNVDCTLTFGTFYEGSTDDTPITDPHFTKYPDQFTYTTGTKTTFNFLLTFTQPVSAFTVTVTTR
jgi:hypothetical protein